MLTYAEILFGKSYRASMSYFEEKRYKINSSCLCYNAFWVLLEGSGAYNAGIH